MNPLYEYLIYLVLGLTIGGIIVLKLVDIYKKRDDILWDLDQALEKASS